jgi:hypothetical protein
LQRSGAKKLARWAVILPFAAGIVGFILGVNVVFLFAGLMRAAREEQEQTKDENKTC